MTTIFNFQCSLKFFLELEILSLKKKVFIIIRIFTIVLLGSKNKNFNAKSRTKVNIFFILNSGTLEKI